MENERSAHRVCFGPFQADFHTQELFQDGTKLKLARQPFQILELLVANPGQLVSREDLQRRLWPEDHFVDATHGLNAAVNKLRDTLGDSADQPRYIETLPRRGYRFIGEVKAESVTAATCDDAGPVTEAAAAPISVVIPRIVVPETSPVTARTFPRWPILTVGAAALVIGSVLGISLTDAWRAPSSPSFAQAQEALQKQQQEFNEQQEASRKSQGTVARRAAESVAKETDRSLADSLWRPEAHAYLQTADFRTIVSGDAGNAAPQFSPDGKRIAFMSNRSGPWQIWMSDADGSNPVQVSFTESAGTPRWSPDGQSIAFDAPHGGSTSVFITSVNGPGNVREVAEGRVPSFSRDGQFLYFASDRSDDWQVWKVPVRGGTAVQVTKSGGFAALESDDGNLYYVKSQREPQLWKIPVNGGAESVVSPLARPRTWSSWTVTCEGILLAMDLPDGKTHLSLYEPRRGSMRELVSLQSAPHWMGATLDGKKVVVNDAAERQITMLDNLR